MEPTEFLVPTKLITLNERVNQEFAKLKLPLTDKLQAFANALPAEEDKEVVILDNLILIASRITIDDENDKESLEKASKFSKLMKKFNGAVDGWAKESKEDADAFRDRINKRRDLLKTKIAEVKAHVDPKLDKIKLMLEDKMKKQQEQENERYAKRYQAFTERGMVYDGLSKRFVVPGYLDTFISEEEMRLLDSDELKKKFAEEIVPTLLLAVQKKSPDESTTPAQLTPEQSQLNKARLAELCSMFGTRVEDGKFQFPTGKTIATDSLYLYDNTKYRELVTSERNAIIVPEESSLPNEGLVVSEDSTLAEKLAADLVMLNKVYNDLLALKSLKLNSEMMKQGLIVFGPKVDYLLHGIKGMINECKAP